MSRSKAKPSKRPAVSSSEAKATTAEQRAQERWERSKANAKTIGGAVLLALFIRIVLFEAFEIEGASMEPSLLHGDRVVVAKFEYGLFPLFAGRWPIVGSIPLLGGDHAVVNWGLPDAGDVVIVHSPADEADIVKRVIGVPGDTIEIRDSVVYRNGEALQQRVVGPCRSADGTEHFEDCEMVEEAMGEHTWYTSRAPYMPGSNEPERVVPPGHIFVLGDHRDASHDSRADDVGFIPADRIKGRALAIYWSNHNRIRWGRIFTGID